MNEITIEELKTWPKDSYKLIDIRDEGLVIYGMMPGAVHIPAETIDEDKSSELKELAKNKKLVFYCQIGRKSRELDEDEYLEGLEMYSLEGGYLGYIKSLMNDKSAVEEKREQAEASIRKKFHK